MNENSEGASSEFASGRSLATRKLATRNFFSQEFPMSGVLIKRNENLTTDFTESHRFFSLRSLCLCGSLFSQELKIGC